MSVCVNAYSLTTESSAENMARTPPYFLYNFNSAIETEVNDDRELDISAQWVEDPHLISPSWLNETNSKVQLLRCGVHTL